MKKKKTTEHFQNLIEKHNTPNIYNSICAVQMTTKHFLIMSVRQALSSGVNIFNMKKWLLECVTFAMCELSIIEVENICIVTCNNMENFDLWLKRWIWKLGKRYETRKGKEEFKDDKRIIRIYKTLDRKLKIKQHQPHWKKTRGAPEG